MSVHCKCKGSVQTRCCAKFRVSARYRNTTGSSRCRAWHTQPHTVNFHAGSHSSCHHTTYLIQRRDGVAVHAAERQAVGEQKGNVVEHAATEIPWKMRCDGWALSCAWHTQVLSRLVGLHTYNTSNKHQGQQGRAGHGCGFEVGRNGSLKLRYQQWLICW